MVLCRFVLCSTRTRRRRTTTTPARSMRSRRARRRWLHLCLRACSSTRRCSPPSGSTSPTTRRCTPCSSGPRSGSPSVRCPFTPPATHTPTIRRWLAAVAHRPRGVGHACGGLPRRRERRERRGAVHLRGGGGPAPAQGLLAAHHPADRRGGRLLHPGRLRDAVRPRALALARVGDLLGAQPRRVLHLQRL